MIPLFISETACALPCGIFFLVFRCISKVHCRSSQRPHFHISKSEIMCMGDATLLSTPAPLSPLEASKKWRGVIGICLLSLCWFRMRNLNLLTKWTQKKQTASIPPIAWDWCVWSRSCGGALCVCLFISTCATTLPQEIQWRKEREQASHDSEKEKIALRRRTRAINAFLLQHNEQKEEGKRSQEPRHEPLYDIYAFVYLFAWPIVCIFCFILGPRRPPFLKLDVGLNDKRGTRTRKCFFLVANTNANTDTRECSTLSVILPQMLFLYVRASFLASSPLGPWSPFSIRLLASREPSRTWKVSFCQCQQSPSSIHTDPALPPAPIVGSHERQKAKISHPC